MDEDFWPCILSGGIGAITGFFGTWAVILLVRWLL